MPKRITHIALTEKIFNKYFSEKSKKEFFIGTIFPDIKHLWVIEREKTHFEKISLSDLKESSSFVAGMKFHSIVDIVRENYMVKNNIYALYPDFKYIIKSSKILEDEILYKNIQDWSIYRKYLDDILSDEKIFWIAENDIKKWHFLLQQYFEEKSSEQRVRDFYLGIGFWEDIIFEISKNIATMRKNEEIISIFKNFHKDFDLLIGEKFSL